MKKYMIVGLLLLQGALLKASEMEFYQAIAPSLQNAKSVLQNPMISAELDPVLNGLLGAVQNGTISKQAALNIINDIKNAVEAYKSKQYSNSWLSWFVSTPKIVKDTVQPALDKVNNAIAALNGNELSPLAITGIVVGSVATAAGVVAGGIYAKKWNDTRKKRAEEAKKEKFTAAMGDAYIEVANDGIEKASYEAGLQIKAEAQAIDQRARKAAEEERARKAAILAEEQRIRRIADEKKYREDSQYFDVDLSEPEQAIQFVPQGEYGYYSAPSVHSHSFLIQRLQELSDQFQDATGSEIDAKRQLDEMNHRLGVASSDSSQGSLRALDRDVKRAQDVYDQAQARLRYIKNQFELVQKEFSVHLPTASLDTSDVALSPDVALPDRIDIAKIRARLKKLFAEQKAARSKQQNAFAKVQTITNIIEVFERSSARYPLINTHAFNQLAIYRPLLDSNKQVYQEVSQQLIDIDTKIGACRKELDAATSNVKYDAVL